MEQLLRTFPQFKGAIMLDPEVLHFVRQEIKRQVHMVLCSKAGETDTQSEEIDELYVTMPKTGKMGVVHPYGFVSRAPQGTICVSCRLGEHAGNRLILGHRDFKRKQIVLAEGDSAMYNADGTQISIEGTKINLGKGATEPAVLGNELKTLLNNILQAIINGQLVICTTPGNVSAPNPALVAQAQAWQNQFINTAATNILSQETFINRSQT